MTGDEVFRRVPYNRFKKFISPGSDRFALICSILGELSLPHRIIRLGKKRHIAVSPGGGSGSFSGAPGPGTIFTAHYDRVPRSSGANDNGAAVFQLLETAAAPRAPRALFIFTDGEELAPGEPLRNQGAYGLGLFLKEAGLGALRIFTFDACGAGDTLIISTAAEYLLKDEAGTGAEAVRQRVKALRSAALDAAREARLEKILLLPTPFSEDAGFLLSGLAAQTVTMLPETEAAEFASLVRAKHKAAGILFSSAAPRPADRRFIPETWRSLNSPSDSPLRLTPGHWKHVVAFALALAEQR
ncbi:MAG: Zn-dependent exopeptidase M28 [Spirochaetaceae bacterium]|nr:Zn-dependent exopeptidase M28 [Spirochaetaceae bacterium]